MFTLKELRSRLRQILDERSAAVAEMRSLVDGVQSRGESELSGTDLEKFNEARAAVDKLDEDRKQVEERIAQLERVQEADDEQREFVDRLGEDVVHERRQAGASVSEPDIYRKGGSHSFFADLRNMTRNPNAADRINRHMGYELGRRGGSHPEARAANDSSDFNSIVTPQYLVNEFAPIAREGMPFGLAIGASDLPPVGLTVTLPRAQTGTLVGSQTTENTAVSSRTYTTDDLEIPVITIAGYNDLSRQSIDRGAGAGADSIIMEDLVGTYSEELDRQLWNGSGANNEHYGILSTTGISTITVSDAGAITQMRQIISALGTLRTNRKRGAQVVFMHPRRWAYMLQAVDGSDRPVVTPTANGPFNTFGRVQPGQDFESNIAGFIHNTPVILDANMPITLSYDETQGSTTDPVVITRTSDLRLWTESAVPNMIEVQPDAKNLTVTVVAWGYSAFTAGRYTTATLVLAGSGLTTPPEVG